MIEVDVDFAVPFLDEGQVLKLCEQALQVLWQCPDLALEGEGKTLLLAMRLSDDVEVQSLNKQFRGKDKPTNVLSFPSGDDMPGMEMVEMPEKYIGDVIVSVDTLKREAQAQNKSVEDHFCHLFIHSVLHLLGYDHIDDTEAEEMERLEIDILAKLGVNNPYHKGEDKFNN